LTKVRNVVGGHPNVVEAAVVGLPHDRWNEAITAFVIPTDDGDVTEEEVFEYAKERFPGFEAPKAVVFKESLPQTATGKIRKRELAQNHEDYYR